MTQVVGDTERRYDTVALGEAIKPLGSRARSWQARYSLVLVLVDALAVTAATLIATAVRFAPGESHDVAGSPIPGLTYPVMSVVLGGFWLTVLALRGAYDRRRLGLGADEYKRVTLASLLAGGVVAIICYLGRIELARGWVAVAFPLGMLLLVVGRYLARQQLHRLRSAGRCVHRVLVVGDRSHVLDLVRVFRRERHAGYAVIGACVPAGVPPFRRDDHLPVLADLNGVRDAVISSGADTVAVAAGAGGGSDYLRRLSWSLEGLGVDLVVAPSLTDVAGPRVHVRPLTGLPLLQVDEPDFGVSRQFGKSAFDVVGSAVLLVLLSPLFAVITMLIKLHDGGPVFFRQQRVGVEGRPFTMLKFRSMVVGAERMLPEVADANDGDGPLFKLRDDPRITPVGRYLRRWSIDELPQLVNVIRGEMSLVGPRPPLPREVAQYGDDVRRRLLVKPGLTGLWQVSGRSDLSWEDSVRLDLYYVENWSLSQDALILWKTIRAVLERRGAY